MNHCLFGPKPPACPLRHANCGDCNTYPCLLGRPAYAEEPRTEEERRKSEAALQELADQAQELNMGY